MRFNIIRKTISSAKILYLLILTLVLLVLVKLGNVTLPCNGTERVSEQQPTRNGNLGGLHSVNHSLENSPFYKLHPPMKHTNEGRKHRIKELCRTSPDPPPSTRQRMHDYFIYYTLVDDHHKILYCTISKASSTTLKHALVNLKKPQLSEYDAKHIHRREVLKKYGLKFLDRFSEREVDYRLDNYYKFLITRDPFERLFSTHRDKFLQPDEKCYRGIAGDEIKKVVRGQNASRMPDVKFWEFVRYVALNVEDAVSFDRHWVPQFYVCDPCNVEYDYVAKVDTLSRDLKNIFKEVGIPWKELPYQNSHGNHRTPIATKFSGIELSDLQKLYQIYSVDMEAFGYRAPWNQSTNGAGTHSVKKQLRIPAVKTQRLKYFTC